MGGFGDVVKRNIKRYANLRGPHIVKLMLTPSVFISRSGFDGRRISFGAVDIAIEICGNPHRCE